MKGGRAAPTLSPPKSQAGTLLVAFRHSKLNDSNRVVEFYMLYKALTNRSKYIRICVYIYIYMYMHTHTHIYIYIYIYIYTDTYTYTYICTYSRIYIYIAYAYMHVHFFAGFMGLQEGVRLNT